MAPSNTSIRPYSWVSTSRMSWYWLDLFNSTSDNLKESFMFEVCSSVNQRSFTLFLRISIGLSS